MYVRITEGKLKLVLFKKIDKHSHISYIMKIDLKVANGNGISGLWRDYTIYICKIFDVLLAPPGYEQEQKPEANWTY